MKKNQALAVLLPFVLFVGSCMGMSMDIQMNRDGSGRVVMEYRYSSILEDLGALDGNESALFLPVSMEDWKKTVERIPGLKLVSHSLKAEKKDTVVNITLDFENEKALASLLDPTGMLTSVERKDNHGTLQIIVLDELSKLIDEDIDNEEALALAAFFMDGYNFSASFSAPGNSVLSFVDGKGETVSAIAEAQTVLTGKKVSFSIGMSDILNYKNGLGLKFIW